MSAPNPAFAVLFSLWALLELSQGNTDAFVILTALVVGNVVWTWMRCWADIYALQVEQWGGR